MRRVRMIAILLGLIAAACSSSGDEPAVATNGELPAADAIGAEGAFPVTVGGVIVDARPERIVSLSPTATEMLFAIGAGPQVVAVDDQSDYPDDAPITDLSGFEPNIEAISTFDPDLVVISFDPGDLVAGLDALDIPTLTQFSAVTLDDTYAQINDLGVATGNEDTAAEVVAGMQSELEALAASVPARDEPLTYYHELDDSLFSATSVTFIGQVYSLAGLVNIADEADVDGFGFPQLSQEYILDEDPDLVFLADTLCCGQSIETVIARPGWDQLMAVQQGQVIELDDDTASRWGPRVVDFFADVVAGVAAIEPAG